MSLELDLENTVLIAQRKNGRLGFLVLTVLP